MKKITLGFLLVAMALVTSCQKEETPAELANPQQLEFEKLQQNFPGLQRFNSLTDYQNFLKAQQKEGLSAPALKSMTDGDFEIFYDEEEFAGTSASLIEGFDGELNGRVNLSLGTILNFSNFHPLLPDDNIYASIADPNFDLEINIVEDNIQYIGFNVIETTGIAGQFTVDFKNAEGTIVKSVDISAISFTGSFIGIFSSEENIKSVHIYSSGLSQVNVGVDDIYLGSAVADTDGDGCLDSDDPIVESDMEETVSIQDCDSGIANLVTETCGITMSDQVNELMASAKNHGAFVSSVAKLAKEWEAAGMISKTEKDNVVTCAAHAEL